MVIKQATTLDIEKFYSLFTLIMHEGYSGYSHKLINHFLQKDYSKQQFYLWLERFFRNIYLALENEEVIGFLVGDYTYGGVGFISWIGVKPEYRGRGIGEALFNTYEKFAIEKKAHLIELYTYPKVSGFYLKLGFKHIGTRTQGYFGQENMIMDKVIGDWNDDNIPKP